MRRKTLNGSAQLVSVQLVKQASTFTDQPMQWSKLFPNWQRKLDNSRVRHSVYWARRYHFAVIEKCSDSTLLSIVAFLRILVKALQDNSRTNGRTLDTIIAGGIFFSYSFFSFFSFFSPFFFLLDAYASISGTAFESICQPLRQLTIMPNIQLLQASVDSEDTSELRILVDHKHIKYLAVDPGLYATDDLCFAPSLIAILPPLPPGDWNEGHISRHSKDGCPYFARITRTQLPTITHVWHPCRIDYLDLQLGHRHRSNVYEATCSQFSVTVVVKFARFSWEIALLDAETRAYRWIDRHHIGPDLLGHITEDGRVIGFAMDRIANAQHAGPEHLSLCQQTLKRLHHLGIKHGDVNKHNFLVRDGLAMLIDFDNSRLCNDQEILDKELNSLEEELHDMSGRGGIVIEEHGTA